MITLTPWKMITSSTLENDNIQAFKNNNIYIWKRIISSTNDNILAFKIDNNYGVVSFMLSFAVIINFMLSFNVIIFDVIIWCYHLVLSFGVVIYFMLSFDVIISHSLQMFVLSFFLVQDGCYHLCYHLMLSFLLSFPPFFLFPENVTHSGLYLYVIPFMEARI